ncbi:MAG: tetratricopeptide repeat protein [Firmicutes bacterium]|nr:tetratricopeptide repeat protein [Bacillota bacterium]
MRYDDEDIKRMERESNRLIGEMKYAEAEAVLREAMRVIPVPPVVNNLAFCRFMQDDPEKAFEILQPNLVPEAHHPFAQALAAQICVALGRRAEAEEYLESAIRDYEGGIPKARTAPNAVAKQWHLHATSLKRAAGDLGHHQLVLDLYRRHETYSSCVEDRFLAGVASFNLGRMERAASYWRRVQEQFADDYAYVAQAVEMGVVPRFSLEYRVPDLSVGPEILKTGAGRMFIAHFLLTGQAPEGDIGAAGGFLKLAVDADSEWGLQFAKNILKYPAVSKTVKTAALSTLVENGIYEKGQPVDVVDEHGREMRMSVETSVVTMEVDEHDREIIGRAAELGRAERYDEAIKILSEAAESDEVSFRVLLCLASLYLDKGDLVQAHDLLSMLSAIEPDVPALLFGLAGYHVKSGDYDEAIRYLNRIDISRASPALRRGIAELREELEGSPQ